MTTKQDLQASERAMQLICATVCGGRPITEQLNDINRIVEAWTFKPEALIPSAMVEDLPPRRL